MLFLFFFFFLKQKLFESPVCVLFDFFWKKTWRTLTRKLDGEPGLADVEIGVELHSDGVEGGVDPLWQQRAAQLRQKHLVLRGSVPDLQHVVAGLRVKGQELKAERPQQGESLTEESVTSPPKKGQERFVFGLVHSWKAQCVKGTTIKWWASIMQPSWSLNNHHIYFINTYKGIPNKQKQINTTIDVLPHNVSRVHLDGPGAAQVVVIRKRVPGREDPPKRLALKTAAALGLGQTGDTQSSVSTEQHATFLNGLPPLTNTERVCLCVRVLLRCSNNLPLSMVIVYQGNRTRRSHPGSCWAAMKQSTWGAGD